MENKSSTVSVEEKKEFIVWFLDNHKLKRRECTWILSYIKHNDTLLSRIRFVEEAHFGKQAIVMSTTNSEGIPFRFYNGDLMTSDAEKALKYLQESNTEDVLIEVKFATSEIDVNYLNVLEENLYVPEEIKQERKLRKNGTNIDATDLIADLEKKNILRAIDAALDSGDEKLFVELCEMLNEVGQKKTLSFSG